MKYPIRSDLDFDLTVVVHNVKVRKKVQDVKFKLISRAKKVRASTRGQPPLVVEKVGDLYAAGVKDELPSTASTAELAFARAAKRFWH